MKPALALALLLAAPAVAQTLCPRLAGLTADPTVAAAHWGISVTRLDGTPVCAVNDAQLFRPASNNKIFTTATALALLGPGATFQTQVYGAFDRATGTVTGDLTLQGGGDANLDSNDLPYARIRPPFAFHDLEDLAAQLAAKGLKQVTGDIVGDDTLFPSEPYPPSWNADDFTWGYGAPVSALTLADNQLRLTVTPGATAGQPALVALDQHGVAFYTVRNEASTVSPKAPAGLGVERLPGSRELRVYGTIAQGAAPDIEQIAIGDPASYAALAFRAVLAARGITVAGGTRVRHQNVSSAAGPAPAGPGVAPGTADCSPPRPGLAAHSSATLLADVQFTNRVSQNLHAELLLHQLGRLACRQGSTAEGVSVIRDYLQQAGVAPSDFLLYDGSGLSDHDLVAPRAFTKFLVFAATQPWFAAWKATLPQAGVEGTLNARFPALKGRIFAKTGTLGESRALSGYLTNAAGQTLVFSILVDNHLPGSADRVLMDRIVTTIAEAP